ncbi:MaoC family dehydratase [Actinosynnema sp. NPDC004786]
MRTREVLAGWGSLLIGSPHLLGSVVRGGVVAHRPVAEGTPPVLTLSSRSVWSSITPDPQTAGQRRHAVQFGRYYEEFEVGAVYKHWPGKTVTEYDDHLFCLLTMNHHPLHMDAHYAAEATEFGRNVVVGNYVYSLLLGMSVPDVSGKAIANLEVESLRHVKPTFHGDTIYGETEVLAKTPSKSKDDRGVVHVETRGYKQDGTVVCVFRRKVMVPKRSYVPGNSTGGARGGEQPGRPEPKE